MTRQNGTAERVLHQKTLKNSIHCSGIGLHGGAKVNMTLHPAEPHSGIVFHRSDLPGSPVIEGRLENVVATPLCTTLALDDRVRVGTVEHLMSALAGCGIDNAVVELSGPEVPVMDGSAAPFVFLIECAGTVEQAAPRRALQVLKEITVSDTERSASIAPGDGFSVEFEIDFDSPAIARQQWSLQVTDSTFKRDVSRARTFGFLEEVDKLRAMGLALGGSLDNAIVISDDRVINQGGLRYENEFVRHKVLDLIGDLYLIGAPILGRVACRRAGHAITQRMLKTLLSDRSAWAWTEVTEADLAQPAGAMVPPVRAVAARA
jgi:UDP-3-O-[3-hydroxymyristoyl] N-acetylglucosamine deacetylase